MVVTVHVSHLFIPLSQIVFRFLKRHAALYEADRLAHEEAIRNGGVRFFKSKRGTGFVYSPESFICIAYYVLVRCTIPIDRLEPRNLYLAIAPACHRSK